MRMQTTERILLHGLFRRWDLFVYLNLAILGTILVGSWLWPPSYQASSSIVILGRTYSDLLTPAKTGGPSTLIMNPKDEINSEIEIIRSRPVLTRVVQELHLDQPRTIPDRGVSGAIRTGLRATLRGARSVFAALGLTRKYTKAQILEAAVERLQRRLVVLPAIDSQIIWIKYRDPDPDLAAKVVNLVAAEYQKQHLAININRAESSFYGEQIDKVQARVDKIQQLRHARPELLIPLPDLAQEQQLSAMEDKYLNLKFQVVTVLQRYTPESRQYLFIQQQIGAIRKQIKDHVSVLLERDLAKLRELQAEEQATDQTIGDMKSQLDQLPIAEMNLGNLERDIDIKQAILSVLLKKYQDSILAQNTDRRLENAKILSLAAPPLKPVFPILWLNLLLGLVFSGTISLSLAFFLEYWDDSLKIPEDVERYLGRSVFASIPEL
jgi:uncharacterized protein involved in exopolysaccharide biosynthesis